MIVRIDEDEAYPVYSFRESTADANTYGVPIDVDPAVIERWRKAAEEWEACQDDMAKADVHAHQRRMDRTERGARIMPTWPTQ
jgi:hypothetical protein